MSDTTLLLHFPGTADAPLALVGGKARSLLRLTAAGLRVPPGAVLTRHFFDPWFERVLQADAWAQVCHAEPEAWPVLCPRVQALCSGLQLNDAQRTVLDEVSRTFAGSLVAVRSSSPDEDLAGTSFAGGYATSLAVSLAASNDDIVEALRRCFASALDARVLAYKRMHAMDPLAPSIAVVVQQQLHSEVAGVAFSLNPQTNDYDEVAVDAAWGQGDNVVAGRVEPDHFVVNTVTGEVIERVLGAKQTALLLTADGSPTQHDGYRTDEFSLSEQQLLELTDVVRNIEELLGLPVDVEWASVEGHLNVLQARPVTAYVPLPPTMVTQPGADRVLYADAALAKGLTIGRPISPLGLDFMSHMFGQLIKGWTGLDLTRPDMPPAEAMLLFRGGRMYMNISIMLRLASPAKMALSTGPTDQLMGEILAAVDGERYRARRRPAWINPALIGVPPRLLWRLRGTLWRSVRALLAPERASGDYLRDLRWWLDRLRLDNDTSPDWQRPQGRIGEESDALLQAVMPPLLAGIVGTSLAMWAAGRSPDRQALGRELQLGASGDVVVEMGMAMAAIARLAEPEDLQDPEAWALRLVAHEARPELQRAWDDFVARYGWRGPQEMDLASPRYADAPDIAARQIAGMAASGSVPDLGAVHERLVARRQAAYAQLIATAGPVRRRVLRHAYKLIERFAGARDTPKHLIVLANYAARRQALEFGQRLTAADRLDAPEDIFDLTFDELALAESDPNADLRTLRDHHRRELEPMRRVPVFPSVIDSRGRILRPPQREERPGEIHGTAVSPGTATGPVRLLHSADVRTLRAGDVLVAHTTDPGWTPLFANAAAVVLEVGGTLQHGAVVAREFGKPCVVGIDRVMSRLRDGQRIEVDGTTGVLRLLDP